MLSPKCITFGLGVIMGGSLIIFMGCNQDERTVDPSLSRTVSKTKPEQPPPTEAVQPAQLKNPRVKLQTNQGDIVIELFSQAAPVTVENFLRYVSEGFYDGIIFHRVMPGFMIQTGGYTADMQQKISYPPIINEASNGLSNIRGAVTMARLEDDPSSATSQFFINLVDNSNLDFGGIVDPYGYAVFGKVVEGMDVVDKIAAVEIHTVGFHNVEKNIIDYVSNIPVEPVIIQKAVLLTK